MAESAFESSSFLVAEQEGGGCEEEEVFSGFHGWMKMGSTKTRSGILTFHYNVLQTEICELCPAPAARRLHRYSTFPLVSVSAHLYLLLCLQTSRQHRAPAHCPPTAHCPTVTAAYRHSNTHFMFTTLHPLLLCKTSVLGLFLWPAPRFGVPSGILAQIQTR